MTNKIQTIILDVDGVLLGDKKNINTPVPHKLIINKLNEIINKDKKIILCTGRPSFSLYNILEEISLDNFHISDGGALIYNPYNNEVFFSDTIKSNFVSDITNLLIQNNIYTELYDEKNYYSLYSQKSNFTQGHAEILNVNPLIHKDFKDIILEKNIIKIIFQVVGRENFDQTKKIILEKNSDLNVAYGTHPSMKDVYFGIITNKGISKESGIKKLFKHYNLDFKNALGVGDSDTDWGFIKLCGYKACVANASDYLKRMVIDNNGFIGKDVNENGLLDIFRNYLI